MSPITMLSLCLSLSTLSACAEGMQDWNDDAGTTGSRDAAPARDGLVAEDAAASPDASVSAMLDAGSDAGPMPNACPRIRVNAPGEMLNIRPSPSTSMPAIGTLPNGALAEVVSMVRGASVGGVDLWYEIRSSAGNGFVHSSFAVCTTDVPPADNGYFVPFGCGARMLVTQAPGGGVSHTGRSMYAYDFAAGPETPIHAMRPGRVTYVFTDTGPGDPCYGGGGVSCSAFSNLVIVQHADGTTAVYKHINSATVSVGRAVQRGDVIARSGSTGYSTGPHLHAEVRAGCPTTVYCNTIPYSFTDVGTPAANTRVTSGNCP